MATGGTGRAASPAEGEGARIVRGWQGPGRKRSAASGRHPRGGAKAWGAGTPGTQSPLKAQRPSSWHTAVPLPRCPSPHVTLQTPPYTKLLQARALPPVTFGSPQATGGDGIGGEGNSQPAAPPSQPTPWEGRRQDSGAGLPEGGVWAVGRAVSHSPSLHSGQPSAVMVVRPPGGRELKNVLPLGREGQQRWGWGYRGQEGRGPRTPGWHAPIRSQCPEALQVALGCPPSRHAAAINRRGAH